MQINQSFNSKALKYKLFFAQETLNCSWSLKQKELAAHLVRTSSFESNLKNLFVLSHNLFWIDKLIIIKLSVKSE